MCARPRAPPPERATPIRGALLPGLRSGAGSAAHNTDVSSAEEAIASCAMRDTWARMCFDIRIMPHPLSLSEKDSRLLRADASCEYCRVERTAVSSVASLLVGSLRVVRFLRER